MHNKIEKKSENVLERKNNSLLQKEKSSISKPAFKFGPFISFRYSSRSMVSFGGKTYIKAKEKRFENGKLEQEEFEGTIDGDMSNLISTQLFKSAQKMLSSLFNPFQLFLPKKKEKWLINTYFQINIFLMPRGFDL